MYVRGDAVRINQIIVNLLTNSAKYTPMGGTITVRLSRSGHNASFVIRDDGMGISAEMLPKIFDMYSQANHAAHSTTDGLGIGLALVKGLVDLHHGSVEARSAGEGCGSEFTVLLPLLDKPVPGEKNDGNRAVQQIAALLSFRAFSLPAPEQPRVLRLLTQCRELTGSFSCAVC
jgi:signal transduction histidine kinase